MPHMQRAAKRRKLEPGDALPKTPPSARRSTRLAHSTPGTDAQTTRSSVRSARKSSAKQSSANARIAGAVPASQQDSKEGDIGLETREPRARRDNGAVKSLARVRTGFGGTAKPRKARNDYDEGQTREDVNAITPSRARGQLRVSSRDDSGDESVASSPVNMPTSVDLHGEAVVDTKGEQDPILESSKELADMEWIQDQAHQSRLWSVWDDDQLPESSSYDLLRNVALSKLSSRRPIPIQHLAAQRAQVHQLLSSTVTVGQGNSLLLLGSRGTGKSALAESVITELAADPMNVAADGTQAFHIIRLNGFIQTDDKLALREIWRQLGRDMEIEEDEGRGRNYADTLASLLALLSHPTELSAQGNADATTEDANQRDHEVGNEKISNAVIFLISEFDAFAARSRQTLLYNLFDIAQSRKAPVAVLGMSARMDVAEMLEKRVKSRFSHRYVYVPPPKSLATYIDVCRAAVEISPEELNYHEQQSLSKLLGNTLEEWNTASRSLLSDGPVRVGLEQMYQTTRSVPAALSALYLPIASLRPASSQLHSAVFPTPNASLSSAKLTHILSLPSLSLALLIAAARLPLLTGSDNISFPLAYDEYRALATKARLAASSGGAQVHGGVAGRVWGKDVARAAWEGLLEAGLIIAEEGTGLGAGGAGACQVDVALEEIEPAVGKGMDKSLVKWCREL